MMQADFYNAYQRHWEDAEFLYNDSRFPNADQLYGYSAECGLKCLMGLFISTYFDPLTGSPPQEDRVHINRFWIRYRTYMAGIGIAGYTIPPSNPFDNWDVSNRYAHKDAFSKTHVDQHKSGAGTVKALINQAILEGRLII